MNKWQQTLNARGWKVPFVNKSLFQDRQGAAPVTANFSVMKAGGGGLERFPI